MKAISMIERPPVIRRIPEHLELWYEEEPFHTAVAREIR